MTNAKSSKLRRLANMILESMYDGNEENPIASISSTKARVESVANNIYRSLGGFDKVVEAIKDLQGNISELFPDATVTYKEDSITYTLKTPLLYNADEDVYENGLNEIELDDRITLSVHPKYFSTRMLDIYQKCDSKFNLVSISINIDMDYIIENLTGLPYSVFTD